MSWLDKVKDKIIITTGDKQTYSPQWINASKEIEWHVAEFYFPGQDGSLVKRSKKFGTKYKLELIFQGENHLEYSNLLERSCTVNNKAWKIEHPFYGVLNVQITGFFIDNTGYNVSKWTGVVIETIQDSKPQTNVDPVDDIKFQKEQLDEITAQSVTTTPIPTDVTTVKDKNLFNFKKTIPILSVPEEIEAYYNIFGAANSAVNNLVASPLVAMRTTLALISAPALFTANIKSKQTLFSSQLDTLRSNLLGIVGVSSKEIYQGQATGVVSSAALAGITAPQNEYMTIDNVFDSMTSIIDLYNQVIEDMDTLQTANGGSPTSFIPSQAVLFGLSQLVNSAISNLFSVGLNAKKQYSIIVEKDTNFILLAHRFYGLDANDKNLSDLIEQNNLGLNGMLHVKKNTKIVYYI